MVRRRRPRWLMSCSAQHGTCERPGGGIACTRVLNAVEMPAWCCALWLSQDGGSMRRGQSLQLRASAHGVHMWSAVEMRSKKGTHACTAQDLGGPTEACARQLLCLQFDCGHGRAPVRMLMGCVTRAEAVNDRRPQQRSRHGGVGVRCSRCALQPTRWTLQPKHAPNRGRHKAACCSCGT